MPHFYKIIVVKLCISLCLLFQFETSTAQPSFSVEHYTSENGLPQNSIKSIAADADGFIWLATEDGLTRFDGRNFEIFENNSMGVHTKRMISILPGQRHPDNRSRLNVAYALFSSDEMSKISGGRASAIGNDLLFRERKMEELEAEKKGIYYVNGLPERWQRTMLPDIPSLIGDSYTSGSFFLCDASTVTYYRRWQKQYEMPSKAFERLNYFTLGGRLYYFDERNTFIQIFENKRLSFQLKGDIVRDKDFASGKVQVKIYWNDNSDQAFFYLNGQLFELVQERDGSLSTRLLISGFDLAAENIDVIFHARENKKLFLGSSTSGLFVISIPQFETIKVVGTDRPNIFYGQEAYDDNTILTPTGIIAGKNPHTGEIIDRRLAAIEKLKTDDRRFIFKDSDGNMWVKGGNTLTRLNRKNQVMGKWEFENAVKGVCQGNGSEFWIGIYEKGIFKIDATNSLSKPEFVGGEAAKHITCMRLKNSDELWVGAIKGLFTVNTKNGKTRLVSGTLGENIRSIQVDDNGRFWVTILNKGLALLSNDNQVTSFPLDERGFLASSHHAIDDGKGFLWIPTNRGLFQMKVSDLLRYADRQRVRAAEGDTNALTRAEAGLFYAYHNMTEGFATNEFNGGCSSCGVKLANGYISLPSIDGLVWFKPEHINRSVGEEAIILDGIFLNRSKLGAQGDTIALPLEPENIRFDFATAHFGNSYNLHVSYALVREGKTPSLSDWLPVDDDLKISIHYSSLSSGNYRLLIRKAAGFGLDNAVVKEIHVIVPEIWYESGWAIFIFVSFFLIVLIFSVRAYNDYRLKNIQSEKDELETIVAMRTAALQTSLTDLDEQVHIMSRMIASISHDVQAPLNQIAIASEDIPELLRENRLEDVSKAAGMVTSAAVRTGKLLSDLLTYVKIQVYGKRLRVETINLYDLIEEKLELFESAITRQENTVNVNVPANFTATSDSQLLSIVIHNLIDNAVKYTRRGIITFNVQTNEDGVYLVIANSGQSLPKEKIDFMNSIPGYDGRPAMQRHEGGSNLGLIIVKEVSQLIGLKISVTQTDTVNFHILFGHSD